MPRKSLEDHDTMQILSQWVWDRTWDSKFPMNSQWYWCWFVDHKLSSKPWINQASGLSTKLCSWSAWHFHLHEVLKVKKRICDICPYVVSIIFHKVYVATDYKMQIISNFRNIEMSGNVFWKKMNLHTHTQTPKVYIYMCYNIHSISLPIIYTSVLWWDFCA